MKINFTKRFAKTLRLSLKLNEFQMARLLGIPVMDYVDFEEAPMKYGGDFIDRYVELLEGIEGVSNLSHIFLEFMKFDLQVSSGAINIFEKFPLRLVPDESEANVC